jgi:hypothetical protein
MMMKSKRFLSLLLAFTLTLSLFIPAASVSASPPSIYTVQYLDKVTNQSIVPPVINAYTPGTNFTVNGQVNFNGFQLDSVLVNNQPAAHGNGAITVLNPIAGSYSIIYFYNDREAPRATIKQYAFFEQNGDTEIADIIANLHDNSGVSNISMKYVGSPPDTSVVGIQNVEIELSDRTGNKTNIKGEVAVVGKARYTASFRDSATGRNIRDTIIAPLTVGGNASLQFSFPAGYELTSVSVDGTEQSSGTVMINNAEERNYNVIFNLRDVVAPSIRVIGQTSFQRGDNVDLEQLFIVTDNSDDPVTLTGNINTSRVGAFNVPITARDATGNTTTINFNYTVYGTNTYTVQYVNKTNNRDLMPRSEPVQFNTRDGVTINLPTTHNGFTLTEVDLGANQSRASVDLQNGRVTLTNLTDTSFVCKAIYLDTTKPIGTARTDIRVRRGTQINAMQCLAFVFDNAGIEGLTAYFSGNPPDTSTSGTKNAVILLRDAAGNVSDPINVSITVDGEDDFTIRVRYIDNDTDRVIRTDTIRKERGSAITRGDLSIPSGYQLVNRNFTYNVTRDSTIDVDVQRVEGREQDGEFTVTIRYVDWERTSNVIGTQAISVDYGQTVEVSDLKLPEGYELHAPFTRQRVYNDNTLTVRVKKASPKEIIITYMDGIRQVGTQTLSDYSKDAVLTSDLILPNGYSLADPGRTSYPKAEAITVAVSEITISVYIVRQSKPGEHSDITVPGKSNNFKILQTFKNSDGSNTSNYRTVIELITDTAANTWYYIVDENDWVDTGQPAPNPIGSSIRVEITNGIVYVATFPEGQHTSYVVGYDEGGRRVFGADRTLTRAEFSTLMYNNFIAPFKDGIYTTSSFADVSADAWYFQPVEAMRQLHIVNGYDEEINGEMTRVFKPNQPITRAEAATLLSRIRNIKPQFVHATYNDLPEGAWFRDYVIQAANLGYFRYVEGAFNPQGPMTRGETIFAFNVAMDRKPFQAAEYRNPFEDLNPTHPYYADIMEATITHNYVMEGDIERRPGN